MAAEKNFENKVKAFLKDLGQLFAPDRSLIIEYLSATYGLFVIAVLVDADQDRKSVV